MTPSEAYASVMRAPVEPPPPWWLALSLDEVVVYYVALMRDDEATMGALRALGRQRLRETLRLVE